MILIRVLPLLNLVRDFLDFLGSFGLTQSVIGPTQDHSHTVDLVLSYGLSLNDFSFLLASKYFFLIIFLFHFILIFVLPSILTGLVRFS